MSWSLVAIAAVSRSNRPLVSQLFLPETATSQDELQLQFLVHSSLDVCEERVDALLKRGMFGAQGQKLLSSGQRSTSAAAGGGLGESGMPSSQQPAAFHSSSTGGVQSTTTSNQHYADNQVQQSPYLERLIQAQRYSSWGYQSNTGIKVIAVTFGADPPPSEIKLILSAIYEQLSVTMCNPFRVTYDEIIHSDNFIAAITNLVFRFTVQGQKSIEMQ